jgi:hypothetical protein
MNTNKKLLALMVALPVLADYIEDLRDEKIFRHSIAKLSGMLMREIRASDGRFFEGLEGDMLTAIADQQSEGSRAFISWIKDYFNEV